jgi:hypothetical protein
MPFLVEMALACGFCSVFSAHHKNASILKLWNEEEGGLADGKD